MRSVRIGFAMLVVAVVMLPVMARAGAVTADLSQRFAALQPDQELPVVVRFSGRVAASMYSAGARNAPSLLTALRTTAQASQAGAIALLDQRGLHDRVRVLWIDNSLAVRATSSLVTELAALPNVESVEFDEPVVGAGGPPVPAELLAASPVWSLTTTNVPLAWSVFGLDGTGVTVGSMDTGCDITHPALAGKWRGGTNSWLDLVNGLPSPYDDHGHGTHTIGTMVGGDAAGPFAPDIGVAPGAKFISCKVLDATNSFSSGSIVVAGAQWMLDPDGNPATNDFPRIINNSWYFFSATYAGYHTAMDAWRAVGIIPVFCIANNGPGASTTNPPGNYDNVIGVGATDAVDAMYYYSSRGPSPSGVGFPSDQRKPDLSAPGAAVTSSLPGGGYGDWYGTSMATPAVAGTIALMMQSRPSITYAQARTALINTAVDLGTPGYDYDYGYGRLDAYQAVQSATASVPPPDGARVEFLRSWPSPAPGDVTFALPGIAGAPADLDVLDLQGRRVWSARARAGAIFTWSGRDAAGSRLPTGIYLVRASQGTTVRTGRVLLIH